MNGFRARRIVELLEARPKHSPDDFARMHVDQYCRPAAPFWRLFDPHLGELTDTYLGVGLHPVLNPILMGSMDRAPLVAYEILVENDATWLKEPREAILAHALYQAIHYLQTAVGPDTHDWQWGRIHPAGFHHPMGSKKPLDRIFNRGPFPYGGDTNTVWQAAFVPKLPITAEGGFTASWRQIFDVGNWDDARGVHTTGQSGHPASPHYDDQIPLWLEGRYHAMPWSRAKVLAATVDKLILSPR